MNIDAKYKLKNFFAAPHFMRNEELVDSTENTKTFKWSGFDDEPTFNSNIKTYSKELSCFVDNPVYYTLNSDNFRVSRSFESFGNQQVDIALGCSLTFGLGMYEEFTWPSILGNMLGIPVLNLGINGGGIDQSYINLNKVIDKLNVRNVYHLQPIYARYYAYLHDFENIKGSSYSHVTLNPIWENEALESVYSEYYRKQILTEQDYINFNHKRGTDAVQGLCAKRDVKYYFIDDILFEYYFIGRTYMKDKKPIYAITRNPRIKFSNDDIASRELIHPTKSQYEKIAKQFYYQVTKSII
jgi:hypothetical protein